ncbi:peptidase M15 [Oxalobacteraceae bacterium OM1]|nr:peptidase M15 [Oxalobacteraceae bacterium OM1]
MRSLTKHFTLEELIASQTATRRGVNNYPSSEIIDNLTLLAETLEQVRTLVGQPIIISSGYRSVELNKAIGGADGSAHTLGLAADINCSGIGPKELACLIRDSGIKFDQLIYEGTWVHIGLSGGAPRFEVLTAHFNGGPASYTKGIT